MRTAVCPALRGQPSGAHRTDKDVTQGATFMMSPRFVFPSNPMSRAAKLKCDSFQPCLGDLCYLEVGAIKSYLDDPSVRALLGVESPGNFTSCSSDVGRNFNLHLDKYSVPSQFYIAGLLERGVRTLIYSGTHDWQCSWPATRLWLDKLEWTGAVLYKSQTFRDWTVDGHKAGEVRTAGPLTFATVRGAGHMISLLVLSDVDRCN